MALSDLLNADLETVGRQLRAGFDWWVDELAAIFPARRRGAVVVELHGPTPEFYRDGRRLAGATGHSGATVALPPAQALVREVTLPRLSKADTRRTLALDLDRLTPLDPATSLFDFEPADAVGPANRQVVTLAVVPRATAERALAQATALGIAPAAIGIADGEGHARFDFLRQLQAGKGARPLWADARAWWLGAGALLLANVTASVYLDSRDVGALSDTVAAQQDAVQLAQRLKGRVRAEDARRTALVARRDAQEPLRPLTAATVAVPAPAWVQRAVWDGHALRLIGFTVEGVDVESALRRSPAFAAVHATSSDIPPTNPAFQPFDLTADARSARPVAVLSTSTMTSQTMSTSETRR